MRHLPLGPTRENKVGSAADARPWNCLEEELQLNLSMEIALKLNLEGSITTAQANKHSITVQVFYGGSCEVKAATFK